MLKQTRYTLEDGERAAACIDQTTLVDLRTRGKSMREEWYNVIADLAATDRSRLALRSKADPDRLGDTSNVRSQVIRRVSNTYRARQPDVADQTVQDDEAGKLFRGLRSGQRLLTTLDAADVPSQLEAS